MSIGIPLRASSKASSSSPTWSRELASVIGADSMTQLRTALVGSLAATITAEPAQRRP